MSAMNGSGSPERLARRLRDLREREWPTAGLTQAQLAEALSAERRVASATLSSWENVKNPKTPTTARLTAYARFFSTRRSLDGGVPHLVPVDDLDDEERERFDKLEEELFELRAAAPDEPRPEVLLRQLLSFDDTGPLVILCPEVSAGSRGTLADEKDINHTRLHRFADADALLHVFGYIRELNPGRAVLHRLPSDVRQSDLQNHLVIIGGIGWNPTLKRIQTQLNKRLPVEQVEDERLSSGEVFRIRDEVTGEERTYFPTMEEIDGSDQLTEDIGLIARLANPFNIGRTLTIFNGVHSKGVLGAVLTLTDQTVRPANEKYLADRFPAGEFAMLIRVLVVDGTVLAPDLANPERRVFEWAPATAGE
jgi:transcriptional regulator with XRE-family HTH domain